MLILLIALLFNIPIFGGDLAEIGKKDKLIILAKEVDGKIIKQTDKKSFISYIANFRGGHSQLICTKSKSGISCILRRYTDLRNWFDIHCDARFFEILETHYNNQK